MEQLGERCGLAVDGDRTEGKFEFEAEFADRRRGWHSEEFDDMRGFRQDRTRCGAGAMVSESGQGEAATAAELGLAQIAAVEGVEDLAPLSGSAGAGHPQPSRGSRKTADGPDRALTFVAAPARGRSRVGRSAKFKILGPTPAPRNVAL